MSGLLTITVAIWQNHADSELQKRARDEGDRRFQKRLQESNEALLTKIKPRFDALYEKQHKEGARALDRIRRTSGELQTTLSSLLPLEDLEFQVEMSEWTIVRQPSAINEPVAQSKLRPAELRKLPDIEPDSAEWQQSLCTHAIGGDYSWIMEVPIAQQISVFSRTSNDAEMHRKQCDLHAYARFGKNVVQGWKHAQVIDARGGVFFQKHPYGSISFGGRIDRDKLDLEASKQFHRNALVAPHFATLMAYRNTDSPFEIILPRQIDIEIRAVPLGLETIEQSWTLQLFPHPV